MKGVKFRIPPRETEELNRLYDLVFDPDTFFAGWAGSTGHYMYALNKKPWGKATNQDGFVYLWPKKCYALWGEYTVWAMSANSEIAKHMCKEYVEINI